MFYIYSGLFNVVGVLYDATTFCPTLRKDFDDDDDDDDDNDD